MEWLFQSAKCSGGHHNCPRRGGWASCLSLTQSDEILVARHFVLRGLQSGYVSSVWPRVLPPDFIAQLPRQLGQALRQVRHDVLQVVDPVRQPVQVLVHLAPVRDMTKIIITVQGDQS